MRGSQTLNYYSMCAEKQKRKGGNGKHIFTCEVCGLPGKSHFKTTKSHFPSCSVQFSAAIRNKLLRETYPESIFIEAEQMYPNKGPRLRHIADKVGVTMGMVSYAAHRLGYAWAQRRLKHNSTNVTHIEQAYARSVGCVICGESRIVEAAHFIAARDGGPGTISNIIPMCPTHHKLYDRDRMNDDEMDQLVAFIYEKYPNLSEDFRKIREQNLTEIMEELNEL